MKGLKTQENNKFKKFFEIVQGKAKSMNKVFFLDCGEGRELITADFEVEDLSGWLIPLEQADEFEKVWLSNNNLDKWSDNIVFAIWNSRVDSEIEIEFKNY